VHFTIALFTLSAAFFVLAYLGKDKAWADGITSAAYWNLWAGAVLTILTVGAGVYAYNTVAHSETSHAAMTNHRNWALATAVLFWGLALWAVSEKRKRQRPSGGFLVVMLVSTGILAVTGWKGGELVYRYGTGVLPVAKMLGPSHHHHHGGAEADNEDDDGTLVGDDHDDHDDEGAAHGHDGDEDHDH